MSMRWKLVYLEGLIFLTALLKSRFGSLTTLGEAHAAVRGQRALLTHTPMTVSDLAAWSEEHRQTISRWVQRVPWLTQVENPNDSRSKLIKPVSKQALEAALTYLDEIREDVRERLQQHSVEHQPDRAEGSSLRGTGVSSGG